MRSTILPARRRLIPAALVLAGILASCVDAPSATETDLTTVATRYVIAPAFSLVTAKGPASSPSQAAALSDAFDLVDHFRMIVVRQSTGAIVFNEVITVTPGQSQYNLQANVETSDPTEVFLVSLVALHGETELFKAESIPVTAVPVGGVPGQQTPPTPVSVPLTYSGPGSTAQTVEVDPANVVVGSGGSAQLGGKVLNEQGSVIADAPLSWRSESNGVATVSATGEVTGVGEGITQIVATAPNGLRASARVYVVGGSLTYVEGGVVKMRDASGGEAVSLTSGSSASAPTWSGGTLYYSEGGVVTEAGGGALFGGGFPSVSPDGSKIAADAGGTIVFANIDGSNPTEGPSGRTPIWYGERSLLVSGGSIETVGTDGSDRTTVVPGNVGLPAMGPGGQVAYVDNGSLRLVGGALLATGVGGRPAWSENGAWIAFPGSEGLMVVPADGSAPPVALPGLGGASDPVWGGGGGGGGGGGVAPTLTGFEPDPPVPGQAVTLIGDGFDDIIKKNNHVFWPGPDGSVETEITGVTSKTLKTTMPGRVVQGVVRVQTFSGEATLDFQPSLGSVEVYAATRDGVMVPGVQVTLTGPDGSNAGSGTTDADGFFGIPGLTPGTYTLDATPPAGYALADAMPQTVEVTAETVGVDIELRALVDRIEVDPGVALTTVGGSTPVTFAAFDVNGRPVNTFESVSWHGGRDGVDAGGSGQNGSVSGVFPTPKDTPGHYTIAVDGVFYTSEALVTSHIQGTITNNIIYVTAPGFMGVAAPDATEPASAVTVELLDGSNTVIARTSTDDLGQYRFDDLFAGTFTVRPDPSGTLHASPATTTITLGSSTPSGTADFTITTEVRPTPGSDIVVFNDINVFDQNGMSGASNPTLIQNLVNYSHAGPRGSGTVVWFDRGRNYRCGYECSDASLATMRNTITGAGFTITNVETTSGSLTSIPADVKVIFLWTPLVAFTPAEVNTLKQFAADGGRVVYIGEYASYYGSGITVENQFLSDMGAVMTNSGGAVDCGYHDLPSGSLRDHQITTGMNGVRIACASVINLGPNDYALFYDTSNTYVLAGVANIDTTPLVVAGNRITRFKVGEGVLTNPPKAPTDPSLNTNSSTGR